MNSGRISHWADLPRRGFGILWVVAFAIGLPLHAAEPEPHAAELLRDVLAARDAVLAAHVAAPERTMFVAFWDFDGTLLRGDCSEGFTEEGKTIYPGLVQACIEKGLSRQYPAGPGAFERCWEDYQFMDQRVGSWLSYPFLPQLLHGASAETVRKTATGHFRSTLAPFYFSSSLHVLRGLEAAGVKNHVISASADVFVEAASETVGLPVERLHGIEQRVDVEGRLTTDIVAPVTYAEGKLQKLLSIVAELHAAEPARQVVVLAAFGNSYSTDGPFLEYTARQTLAVGARPVVVMINGGDTPARYAGLFRLVDQKATIGPVKP